MELAVEQITDRLHSTSRSKNQANLAEW